MEYPIKTLCNLAHCLPASLSAQITRVAFREWTKFEVGGRMVWPRNSGKGGANMSNSSANPWSGGRPYNRTRRDDSRDRSYRGSRSYRGTSPDRNRRLSSRRRSHSSESSEEYHAGKRLERAKKLVEEKDPSYKAYLDSEQKKQEAQRVVEQGRAMAEALAPALGKSLGVAIEAIVPPAATHTQAS